jgi:hypothetical protein
MHAQSPAAVDTLLGRDELLEVIGSYLRHRSSVLLVGARDIGKSAIIGAVVAPDVTILDPFEGVSPHLAGHIRRAMDNGVVFLAGARSIDRARLGAVRRIAWRFATIRVPPLPTRWMREVARRESVRLGLPPDAGTKRWLRDIVRLSRGHPGRALGMLEAGASVLALKGRLPSPAAALIEASVRRHRTALLARRGSEQPA